MRPIPSLTYFTGVALSAALLCAPARADALHDALAVSMASGDTQTFVAVVKAHDDPESLAAIFAWLKSAADSGQAPDSFVNFLVPFALRANDIPDALLYLSYYRALISLDSAICPDKSSGGSLLEGSIFLNARLLRDPAISAEQKTASVDRALALEAGTSRARTIDPALCGAGLGQYAKDLNVPQPPQPALPTGRYADDAGWRQARTEALPNLRKALLAMAGATVSP
jgi:hypothetical protein